MANTKFILSKIKIADALQDVIAKSTGDYVTVVYKDQTVTLATALAGILADVAALPAGTDIDTKITTAVNSAKEDIMGAGVPETYDTLKEIADYIAAHEEVAEALNAAIGNKVDKVEGKGLSTEDFTTELKAILTSLPTITAQDVTNWNNKVDKVEGKGLSTNDYTDADKQKVTNMPTINADNVAAWNNKVDKVDGKGLSTNDFTNELKTKLEDMKAVRVGETVPADMKDGELFIQMVTEE